MSTCSRAWEVEAARDGRLTGKARETHEAHLHTCASCTRDSEALEALARGLRGVGAADVDDVSIRRLRNRVLEAVDAAQTGRVRSGERGARRPAPVVALLLAAMVLGCVAFASWRARAPRADVTRAPAHDMPLAPVAPVAASQVAVERAETRVEVSSGDDARYTRTTEAAVERFELLEGTLRLRVQRPVEGRRVVVTVPDGEIEDVGTVFEVVVTDGHVERVSVDEGRVIVRLADRAPVTVESTKAWRRSVATKAKRELDGRASAPANPNASASVGAARLAEGEREDAAYLDVLRLMREGHDTDARAAASRYLRDFPAGFRRAEMERVAKGQRQR